MVRILLIEILAVGLVGCHAMQEHMMMCMPDHPHDQHTSAQATSSTHAATTGIEGEVTGVSAVAQELTVRQDAIDNAGIAAMTMTYRVQDPTLLGTVRPGDRVSMTVKRVNGALTIVALTRRP